MTFKLNALVAAAAVLAAAGAQASSTNLPSAVPGSSSVLFVAYDKTSNGGQPGISFAVETGYNMADFLAASGTQGVLANTVLNPGSLSAPGSGFSLNVAALGGSAWTSFLSTVNGTAGDSYTWGVIGGDQVPGTTPSATNVVANYNYLQTGTPVFTGSTSAKVSSAVNNLNLFETALPAGVATTSTAGATFLGQTMKGNYGSQSTFSYLTAVGATTYFTWFNQQSAVKVYSIGETYGVGALAADAATFTFDGTNLVYSVPAPVPEPGSYALLMAGLAAVGFMVRRRNQG